MDQAVVGAVGILGQAAYTDFKLIHLSKKIETDLGIISNYVSIADNLKSGKQSDSKEPGPPACPERHLPQRVPGWQGQGYGGGRGAWSLCTTDGQQTFGGKESPKKLLLMKTIMFAKMQSIRANPC